MPVSLGRCGPALPARAAVLWTTVLGRRRGDQAVTDQAAEPLAGLEAAAGLAAGAGVLLGALAAAGLADVSLPASLPELESLPEPPSVLVPDALDEPSPDP